jgi:hypothetical protein
MIGPTIGGMILTVIIEPTDDDPSVCDVVTAWAADEAERKAWSRGK